MVVAENTHLLCNGKYHCSADLLFDQLGFNCLACVELDKYLQVLLYPNQSNRRSAIQWYFPYEVNKWVFSGYIHRTLKPKVIDIFVYRLEPADFRFRLMERDAGRRREGRRLRRRAENGSKQFSTWAVVVAQLVEWLLPTPVQIQTSPKLYLPIVQ